MLNHYNTESGASLDRVDVDVDDDQNGGRFQTQYGIRYRVRNVKFLTMSLLYSHAEIQPGP